MLRFIVRVLVNAVALYVAGRIVGATIPTDLLNPQLVNLGDMLVIALIFGFLNALVRPVLDLVTCPAYVLTLGLFTFIMNMFILWMLQGASNFVLGHVVLNWGGWWNMFLAGIIVTIVSFGLNMLLGDRRRA